MVTLDDEVYDLIKAGSPRCVPVSRGIPLPEVDIVQQLRHALREHRGANWQEVYWAILRLAREDPPRLFIMRRDERILFVRRAGADESYASNYRVAIQEETSFPRLAIEDELSLAQAALIAADRRERPIDIISKALALSKDFCRVHSALLKTMEILRLTETGYEVQPEPAMLTPARIQAATGSNNPRARRPVEGIEDPECLALLTKFRAAADPLTGLLPGPLAGLCERTTVKAAVVPEHVEHLRQTGFLSSDGDIHSVKLAE